MAPEKTPKPENRGRFKTGRRPHNAPTSRDLSLKDLVLRIASEPRSVVIDGKARVITRAERILRLTVARALEGKARDIDQLLKAMIKNPELAASHRTETVMFFHGPLARLFSGAA
jgi:hypothetical protein